MRYRDRAILFFHSFTLASCVILESYRGRASRTNTKKSLEVLPLFNSFKNSSLVLIASEVTYADL